MSKRNTIFKRHLLPFTAPVGGNAGYRNVFITVEIAPKTVGRTADYTTGEPVPEGTVINVLSITGVEGPLANGDACGSCGQIGMHMDEAYLSTIQLAEGWTMPMVKQLLEVWKNYHLNDMKAGCDHWAEQGFDPKEKLVIHHLNRTTEAYTRIKKVTERMVEDAIVDGVAFVTEEEQTLLATPGSIETGHPERYPSPYMELKKEETKTAGWVYPKTHDRGLLGRECKVCGLKYGSGWYINDLPEDVLAFLTSLPESPVSLPGKWGR